MNAVPEGWERIEADEVQAGLFADLHPAVELELTEPLYVGATEGCTGALLADPGQRLVVRSIGNNVARVENTVWSVSALVQLSQLAACLPRRWSSGA